MKKTTLAVALALAGFTSIASAAPQSNAFYVGGKLGWSKYFNTHVDRINLFAENDDEYVDSVKTNDFGAGLYLGYQVNQYAAIEAGFDYLGKMKYKGEDGDDLKVRVMGGQLTAKLSYPLDFILSDLDIYGRGGLMVTRAKVKGDNWSSSKTNVAPVFALGFDYRLTDNLSTRLEYQWVQTLNANTTVDGEDLQIRPDNGLLSVGLTYSFGSAAPEAPAPAAPVEVVQETQVIELSEDVLFAFGKDALRPEGKQILTNLVNTLAEVDPTSGSVVVIGHTDRIGSDAYNLKLSEKRADIVRDYLVQQGVPADVITARGVGKADSVTGTQCNGITNRNKLIACLAPDRRVVIEVNAETTQDVEVEVQPAVIVTETAPGTI